MGALIMHRSLSALRSTRSSARVARVVAIFVLAVGLAAAGQAQIPDGPPRVSPPAVTSQVVGLAEVSVSYSRPGQRGRTLWGELVPYGEVWRTGANEATTITFSHDATIEGQAIAAGTYAFFTEPGPDSWTLIFNSEAEQWGSLRHDPAKDVLRVEVTPQAADPTEWLTVAFPEVAFDRAVGELRWGALRVPFEIRFATETEALSRARRLAAMATDTPEGARGLYSWVAWMAANDIALDEAGDWAALLAEVDPGYRTQSLHARLLAANGEIEAARRGAERALALAAEQPDARRVQQDAARLAEELRGW
ncbi:MAG: DUF2911 domain-containing protein [Acidobacteriota bacterium]